MMNDAVVFNAKPIHVIRSHGRTLFRREAKTVRLGESGGPLQSLGKCLSLDDEGGPSSLGEAFLHGSKHRLPLRRVCPENLFELAESSNQFGNNQLLPLPKRRNFGQAVFQ